MKVVILIFLTIFSFPNLWAQSPCEQLSLFGPPPIDGRISLERWNGLSNADRVHTISTLMKGHHPEKSHFKLIESTSLKSLDRPAGFSNSPHRRELRYAAALIKGLFTRPSDIHQNEIVQLGQTQTHYYLIFNSRGKLLAIYTVIQIFGYRLTQKRPEGLDPLFVDGNQLGYSELDLKGSQEVSWQMIVYFNPNNQVSSLLSQGVERVENSER